MRWRSLVAAAAVVLVQVWTAPSAAATRDDWPQEWHASRSELVRAEIEHRVFRLEVPFRTQKDGSRWHVSNCGPATLGMILDGFGLSGQGTDDLRLLSHTYQGTVGVQRVGTALQHITRVAEDFGVPTTGLYDADGQFHAWTTEELRQQLQLGRPVMALVRLYLMPGYEGLGPRWGHYVLLTGLTEDGFFYSDSLQTDPANGPTRTVSAPQLARAMANSYPANQAAAFGGPSVPLLSIWTP
jgi:hypothetical protein